MSASVTQVATGSRSRTQARKKVNDDAAYFGPPTGAGASSNKRQATDKADGDLSRAKRKRVEASHAVVPNGKKDAPEPESRKSLVSTRRCDGTVPLQLTRPLPGGVPQNVDDHASTLYGPIRYCSFCISLTS